MLIFTALLGCSGSPQSTADSGDAATSTACDPIAPTLCGLPFPSTFYMKEDTTSPTGWRVDLGATTMPVNANDVQPDPWIWNERDGWTVAGPIMAHFPGMSLTGVVGHDDIGASLLDTSAVRLIDAQTGERVPQFAELDMSHDDPDRRMLLIYPAQPLEYGRRYVVSIAGLVDASGGAIAPSAAFAALRDGTSDDTDRQARYDSEIRPVLAADGVDDSALVLAWDFITGSEEGITGRATFIRDDLYARIGEGGPSYTITEIEEQPAEWVGRRISGEMTVPLYTEEDDRGTLLTRDADGMPYANGETVVPFIVVIPQSVLDGGEPVPILQYGHGLLGSREELTWGGHTYLPELADRYGYVLIAVDWTGMKDEDEDSIKLMLVNEIDRFAMIPERSHQGFAEFHAALRMISGDLAQDAAMMTTDPKTGASVSVVDTQTRYYYGNSQGGILGGAYVALSDEIQRATLGVGGSPYSLLLYRSADFEPFFQVFDTMYPDPLQVALWMGYMQTLWDSGESSGYLNMLQDTAILQQVGIGDAQVNTLGAHTIARATGSVLIDTPAREVWGLQTEPSGYVGSALVEWDYGAIEPTENIPPDESTDTHEGPRRELSAQEQMHHFFQTGEIINTCDGVCSGEL